SSRRRHTRSDRDWSSDVCSSDLRALFGDMGRVLASITADARGWHDTVTGHLDADGTRAKYGDDGGYQAKRNERQRNTRDNALVRSEERRVGKGRGSGVAGGG